MSTLSAVRATVCGRVQGVFFRDFVNRRARDLDLAGYVRNAIEGTVEVYAEGEKKQLEELIGFLKVGSTASKVEKVLTNWSEYTGSYTSFAIRH